MQRLNRRQQIFLTARLETRWSAKIHEHSDRQIHIIHGSQRLNDFDEVNITEDKVEAQGADGNPIRI